MQTQIDLIAEDGTDISFIDDGDPKSGAMKDVYFSPDKSYVVAFYKKTPDFKAIERLEKIVGEYRESLFNSSTGSYWEDLFCWPTKMVNWNDKVGIVVPCYNQKYFFSSGKFKGKEKEGKWFTSAKLCNRLLTKEEKGNWFFRFKLCIKMARAVRRLHAVGLSHSDLSYKNVLVDPETGSACVIDIDGLVVPGKYPPDVVGTPDFIAPEVMETKTLSLDDPNRHLPNRETDLHALAVLIYMYLFLRHPLKGKKVNSLDATEDEELSMGKMALFIENPNDYSNRPDISGLDASELPQGDIKKRPYTLAGPYLKALFDRAFIDGLHNPKKRPTALEWEEALLKTVDLMQPCSNPDCNEGWYVFANNKHPQCPFCGKKYQGVLPVLDFYYSPRNDKDFKPENHRLMVYDQQCLYKWHINRNIVPNEKLLPEDAKSVGDFQLIKGHWVLINRALDSMFVIETGGRRRQIMKNSYIELKNGMNILFTTEPGGRLAHVSLSNI